MNAVDSTGIFLQGDDVRHFKAIGDREVVISADADGGGFAEEADAEGNIVGISGETSVGEPHFCIGREEDMGEVAFCEDVSTSGIEFLQLFNGKHGEVFLYWILQLLSRNYILCNIRC